MGDAVPLFRGVLSSEGEVEVPMRPTGISSLPICCPCFLSCKTAAVGPLQSWTAELAGWNLLGRKLGSFWSLMFQTVPWWKSYFMDSPIDGDSIFPPCVNLNFVLFGTPAFQKH